jgi:hypothetical protein
MWDGLLAPTRFWHTRLHFADCSVGLQIECPTRLTICPLTVVRVGVIVDPANRATPAAVVLTAYLWRCPGTAEARCFRIMPGDAIPKGFARPRRSEGRCSCPFRKPLRAARPSWNLARVSRSIQSEFAFARRVYCCRLSRPGGTERWDSVLKDTPTAGGRWLRRRL